jgi:hypothetical protein
MDERGGRQCRNVSSLDAMILRTDNACCYIINEKKSVGQFGKGESWRVTQNLLQGNNCRKILVIVLYLFTVAFSLNRTVNPNQNL